MIILGLVILVAAVVIGVVGVLSNSGSAHEFTGGFSVFGVDVTGSTGTLFLYGIVVGAAALLGLSLLLTGARRAAHRGRTARRGLKQSRRETAAAEQERGVLINERDSARAQTAQAERDDEDPAGLVDRPVTRTTGSATGPLTDDPGRPPGDLPRAPQTALPHRMTSRRSGRHRLAPSQPSASIGQRGSHAAEGGAGFPLDASLLGCGYAGSGCSSWNG